MTVKYVTYKNSLPLSQKTHSSSAAKIKEMNAGQENTECLS
jgi:hypothetical protein